MIDKRLRSEIAQRKLIISTAEPCTLTVLPPDLLRPAVGAAYIVLGDL